MSQYDSLFEKEGWPLSRNSEGREVVEAYGQTWLASHHPVAIHFKLYRTANNPKSRFFHMKKCHDYLWPDEIKYWNHWSEARFMEHCLGEKCITYAGGAHSGKSHDAAKIVLLWWLADPEKRGVIVASTTLESLQTRIWGYVLKFFNNTAIPIPGKYSKSPNPKILYKSQFEKKGKQKAEDPLHGMFAVTAKTGDDEKTISTWIGKHPENGLMLVLDEATDMPPAILKAIPNLETARGGFQMMAIGNSNSKFDLHGALSTPKGGWHTIDPMTTNRWETNNGVCLFFNCYDSPAIVEPDLEKRKVLGDIFVTQAKLDKKIIELGKDSDVFWRMVIGFWRNASGESTVFSQQFLETFQVVKKAEWSGIYPLNVVAGLDAAFSAGGDQCLLRLAYLGADTDGKIVMDCRGDELLYKIQLLANSDDPIEIQIADQVIAILKEHNCRLDRLAVDGTGQGRAIGSVIALRAKSLLYPKVLYSVRQGVAKNEDRHIQIISTYQLWMKAREFIEQGQIKGLDSEAMRQFATRMVKNEVGKPPKIENKKEYRARMGSISPVLAKSPDEADTVALCLQSALMNFGFSVGQKVELKYQGTPTPMFKQIDYMNQAQLNNQMGHPGGRRIVSQKQINSSFTSDITSLVKQKFF